MNGVLVVLVSAGSTWAILRAIRDVHRSRRRPSLWEQDVRQRQIAREVDESAPIVWRR